ncbi:MAG: YicC family protein [Deltaproteobacteria bacterium]|nr:YicC family protein [Deltaproteobacteria bacterium]
MNSMTGFGRGEASNGTVTVVVEMKSVNNRYRDVQIRVPRSYNVVESRIQKALKDRFARGRIDVFVRRECSGSDQTVRADPALAEHYLKAAAEVSKRLARDEDTITTAWVLAQPGVLMAAEQETDALAEWGLVETALVGAANELEDMRRQEGKALQRDLDKRLMEIQELRSQVASHADGIVNRLHARIEERITRLLSDRIDPIRLAQEAALLADKADVAEELARISSHCVQFAESLASSEPVGRKLDFLLQELNREINTIGSKAAETPVAKCVVEMKSVLERMREQAANVE